MTVMTQPAIVAAGVICWRRVDAGLQVLLVNRGTRADVSWPKGKQVPGESLPEAAGHTRHLADAAGPRVLDLLFHLPERYQDRQRVTRLADS